MQPSNRRQLAASSAIILTVGGSLCLATGASGASSAAARTIQVFVTPALNGHGGGPILITGGIGDYGKSVKADAAGTPDPSGSYSLAQLSRGNILLNTTELKRRIAAGTEHAQVNTASCSLHGSASANVPVVRGTGAYSGIKGSLSAKFTFAEIGARYASGPNKGKCDQSKEPVAQWASVTGSGTVTLP